MNFSLKSFVALIFLNLPSIAFSEVTSVSILNKDLALQATYVSSELDNPAFKVNWFHSGQLLAPPAARAVTVAGGTVCSLWAFYFAEDRTGSTPATVKDGALNLKSIPFWKNVSGKLLFFDPISEYALSYNCVKLTPAGQLQETSETSVDELNSIFGGVIRIENQ